MLPAHTFATARRLALGLGLGLAVVAASFAPGAALAHPPATTVSHPHEDSYYPAVGDPSVDVLHYGLQLRWDDAARVLRGVADLSIRVPRTESLLKLDLERQLSVASVTLDGASVTSTHRGKELVVSTGHLGVGSRHRLVVRYSGTPAPYRFPGTRSDIPALGWTTESDGQVWSMQEPYGAFTWYPSNDQPADKASYDVTITNRASWHGVSNGTLISDRVHDGRRTSHFRLTSPASSYLVALAIGPYRRYTDTGPHGLPLTYWVRPVDRHLLPVLRRTPGLLAALERRLGTYPFASAGTVIEPSDSAMETETMVSFGNRADRRPSGFVSDLLHEYAHSWYGDSVTPNDWRDLWLNESFTMFNQIRWEIGQGYESEAEWRSELAAIDASLRAEGGPPGAYKKDQFGSGTVYYSGARMLFALRDRLGEKTFDGLLRAWPQQHRYASVDRAEWVRFADAYTHRRLDGFVRHWLLDRRAPRG